MSIFTYSYSASHWQQEMACFILWHTVTSRLNRCTSNLVRCFIVKMVNDASLWKWWMFIKRLQQITETPQWSWFSILHHRTEGHHRPPAGPLAFCLSSNQVSRWCSQYGTALHFATPLLPRDIGCLWSSRWGRLPQRMMCSVLPAPLPLYQQLPQRFHTFLTAQTLCKSLILAVECHLFMRRFVRFYH